MLRFYAKIRNKSVFAIALLLMLSLPTLLVSIPAANAADFDTYAFLALSTNPVGVNQNLYVVCWLSLPPPGGLVTTTVRWENLTVTITLPDGSTELKGPYTSDTIGQIYFGYVPTQTGAYKFQFNFPGQTIAGNYYKPSSSPQVTLTVQQEQIQPLPDTPLPGPNDYWQRPISGNNIQWTSFSGNWLALGSGSFGARLYDPSGSTGGNFNPYTKAPNTAHILWTKPNGFGGVIGGSYNNPPTYYTGNAYEGQFTPPVIMNGILYYNTANPPKYGFQAIDLRTGKQLWYQNSTGQQPNPQINTGTLGGTWWPGITNGQILNYVTENQYGGIPFLWQTFGTTWSLYDAFTGNWILNLANASLSSPNFVTDSSGTLFAYMVGDSWIAMWNSTKAIPMSTTIPGYRTWRPVTGITADWRNGIEWNVTIAQPISGQSIAKVGDIVLTTSARDASPGSRIEAGYDITTGEQLWVQNRTVLTPGSNNYGLQGPMAEGVYTLYIQEKQAWYGFSTQTGQQLWGPTQATTNAWSMYNSGGAIAYGRLYALSLDGIHVYNLTTGDHLWDYSVISGVNTIYGVWPFELGGFTIADEKVYIPAGHSHGILPQYTGTKMYVVNAITGEPVFDVLGWMQSGWTNSPVVADGILITQNGYDNQIYAFGKGLSATTISASPITVIRGSPTTIQGTVTDQSPGQTCLGIPAAGTPAVSDESMSRWMEYLYQQQPKPTNTTGVPVTLIATNENGEAITIGTVTSDANGNYAIQWTPPSTGIYKITANFAGTNSYWPSSAEIAIGVTEAPASPATPSPTSTSPTTTTPTETSSPMATTPAPTLSTASPTPAPQPDSGVPTETLLIIAAAVIIIAIVVATAVLLRKRA